MPKISDERDTPAEVLQRAAQQDPWVMYLVVRHDVPASAHELLIAGAQATMRCADGLAESEAWREPFEAWAERSFRKVTLRARGKDWAKLAALDAGVATVGDAEVVRALPPRLRSRVEPFIRHFQVYAPDPATLPASPTVPVAPSDAPAMTFVLNPRAVMSLGKTIAQVAHAVLMSAWSRVAAEPRHRDAFAAWRAAGYPGRIAPPDAWERALRAEGGVVVRDAGLTEVAPGTETVIALPPGHEI